MVVVEGQQEVSTHWVVAAGRQQVVEAEQRVERAYLMAAGEVLLQMVSVMLWEEAEVLLYLVVVVEPEVEDPSWIEKKYRNWVLVLALGEVSVDLQPRDWLLQTAEVVKILSYVELASAHFVLVLLEVLAQRK